MIAHSPSLSDAMGPRTVKVTSRGESAGHPDGIAISVELVPPTIPHPGFHFAFGDNEAGLGQAGATQNDDTGEARVRSCPERRS